MTLRPDEYIEITSKPKQEEADLRQPGVPVYNHHLNNTALATAGNNSRPVS